MLKYYKYNVLGSSYSLKIFTRVLALPCFLGNPAVPLLDPGRRSFLHSPCILKPIPCFSSCSALPQTMTHPWG